MKAITLILSFAFAITINAQDRSKIIGTWKGTSICQVKNSPCNDEVAVYHASALNQRDSFEFQMNKMVEGKEEEMGKLGFVFYKEKQTLISTDTTRDAIWTFVVKGNKIEGTLYYKRQLYRVISLIKE
jgi:hypothetical protein